MKSKTMKSLALVLTVIMVFLLAGCEVSTSSSSTTTVTTSTTDENGVTTTTTTTTEVGGSAGSDGVTTTNQTTTETTTTSADEADAETDPGEGLREHLISAYNAGAEGTNEAGDHFFYAYNEDDGNDDTLLVILSADESSYNGWEGTSATVDDHVVLTSDDQEVPYTIENTEGGFILTFLNDGDVATMQFADIDTVADDVVAARLMFAD